LHWLDNFCRPTSGFVVSQPLNANGILINPDFIFMKKLLLVLAVTLIYNAARAQSAADSTAKHSPLKTLNDVQYRALIDGEDIDGMSLAGELNHYPMPDKVLKYKTQLDLGPAQVTKLTAVAKELRRKRLEMGLIIIHNERTLDSIFKYNRLDNGSLIFYTNRYGLYQGELRNAILQACLATKGLLSQQQIHKYEALQKAN